MSDCNSIYLDNLNIIVEMMTKQCDLEIEVELDEEEQKALDVVADFFSNYCLKENIAFNSNEFKSFAKKLYPKNSTQFGGDGEDAIVSYNEPKTNKRVHFTVSDFLAILAFLSSIFMVYLAYIKLNQIVIDTTSIDIGEMTTQLTNDIKRAAEDVMTMPNNELTFVKLIYNSISTFSCSIVNSQIINVQTFVIRAIKSSFENAEQLILNEGTKVCGLQTQVLSESWGTLGFIVNSASAAATAFASGQSTQDCVIQVTGLKIAKLFDDQKHVLNILTIQFSTQGKQISDLIKTAGYIGATSIGYFSYRLKDIIPSIRSTVPMIREIPNFEDLPRLNSGGRKTKKTRKNKRKTKKNKRKTRKNKRKTRKIRINKK